MPGKPGVLVLKSSYSDVVAACALYIFLVPMPVYNSFRSRATGMFNCSLYLATVRRAIL